MNPFASVPPRCAERFRPVRPLADGSFGVVWLAAQVDLDRPVALKVLHAALVADDESRARFLAEARVASALAHPNIVKVLDHDVEDGVPWIAYEHAAGPSLDRKIQCGPLAVDDVVSVGLQVGAALDHAHGFGVLHRDLKPANVLEDGPDRYKVTDFGVAKYTRAVDLTQPGVIVGTPTHLAPECLRGAPASADTDVYALGVMLFELLTGRHPYDRDLALILSAPSRSVPRPSAARPDVPEWLDRIVVRAMAPERAHRYRAMRPVVEALAAGSRAGPRLARSIPVGAPSAPRSTAGRRSAPPLLASAGVLCAILLAVNGRGDRTPGPVETRATTATAAATARPDPVVTELTASASDAETAWLVQRPKYQSLTHGLVVIGQGPDLSLAQASGEAFQRGLGPPVERLESLLARALSGPAGSLDRSARDEMDLATSAAKATVYRLRLDHVARLTALIKGLRERGNPALLEISDFAYSADTLRYDPALAPRVERFLRLAGAVIARAGSSTDHRMTGPVLLAIPWVGGCLRPLHFPPAAQASVDRVAARVWQDAAASAADDAGKRLARTADMLWRLGIEQDPHRTNELLAQTGRELDELGRLGSEASSCLPQLREMLRERLGNSTSAGSSGNATSTRAPASAAH